MTNTFLTSSAADSEALTAAEQEHAELTGALLGKTDGLLAAARTDEAWQPARDALVAWYRTDAVLHIHADEQVLYPAAQVSKPLKPLVRALLHERALLDDTVGQLQTAGDLPDALMHAGAVHALFATLVSQQNDLLLPAMATTPEISLAQVLADTRTAIDGNDHRATMAESTASQESSSNGRSCNCHADSGEPELDARTIPHAIRHATIFGALDAVAPATSLVLVAPHDPLPLLGQLHKRSPNAFDIEYLQRGPEAWRLRFTRNVTASATN